MSKSKLSQIATTWVDEDPGTKKKELTQDKNSIKMSKKVEERIKKKQTFNLKEGTINRLWGQRVKTGKTISRIIDELVSSHLPVLQWKEVKEK